MNLPTRIRWSTLSSALDSALHLRHRLSTPREDTAAMRNGRNVHAAVLQPDRFDAEAILVPAEYTTGTGTLSSSVKAKAWLAELPDDPLLVTADDMDRCLRIRDAVHAHPDAGHWLRASTVRERRMEWSVTVNGLAIDCHGTPDAVAPSLGLVWDLKCKTPRSNALTVRACVSEIIARHYLGQLSFYRRGLPESVDQVGWVFVDPRPPFDVLVLQADEEMVGYGDELADRALKVYADALKTDQWPGVAPAAVLVSLPAYLRDDGDAADGLDFGEEANG